MASWGFVPAQSPSLWVGKPPGSPKSENARKYHCTTRVDGYRTKKLRMLEFEGRFIRPNCKSECVTCFVSLRTALSLTQLLYSIIHIHPREPTWILNIIHLKRKNHLLKPSVSGVSMLFFGGVPGYMLPNMLRNCLFVRPPSPS